MPLSQIARLGQGHLPALPRHLLVELNDDPAELEAVAVFEQGLPGDGAVQVDATLLHEVPKLEAIALPGDDCFPGCQFAIR